MRKILLIGCGHMGSALLDAWYRNNPNVTVNNDITPFKYHKYGVNLLGFNHGDKVSGVNLALKMLMDNKEDLAGVTTMQWHLGHLHKLKEDEYQGIRVKHCPSLCSADAWHFEHGYSAQRCSQAYIWSKTQGYVGHLQHNPKL